MRKALIFLAIGIILVSLTGLLIFPNVRSDIIEMIPFLRPVPKAVTLKYWGIWEPREVIQPLLDQYQAENPLVTIEYEERDPKEYAQLLDGRFGAEGGPDIVRVHASWVPWLKSRIAPIPDTVLSEAAYEQTFYPVNKVFQKSGTRYYAIPLMVDGLALVYNQKIFTDEGIASPPKNWNEFRQIARQLTKRDSSGKIVQAGAALGYADNIDYFSDILGLMFAQNGVQFDDVNGAVTFHSSFSPVGGNLGAEALKFYTLFSTTEQSYDQTWGNSTDEFIAGRVAMVFLPNHRILKLLGGQSNLSIGVAEVPQLPAVNGEVKQVTWGNYWVETVAKTATNSEEAWKFLNWLSQKEQLTNFYRIASNVRAFGEPFPRTDMAAGTGANAYAKSYLGQAATATTWYFTGGVINNKLNDPIIASLKKMVNSVSSGSATSDTAIATAASEIQSVLTTVVK